MAHGNKNEHRYVFFDLFDSIGSVRREFEISDDDLRDTDEVIVASYEYSNYSGSAFVLFVRDGELFEAHGSHCSCYGLEGQWSPELVTVEDLRFRAENGGSITGESGEAEDAVRSWLRGQP